jgi:hypothetical protein
VTGGTAPYIFTWSSGDISSINQDPVNPEKVTFVVNGAGTLKLHVVDAHGCTTDCERTVGCTPASQAEFCSLTQGFFGNAGGKFNGQGTLSLIQSLICPSNDLVVGKPGRSLMIQCAAASCIIQRLPANGSARALPESLGDALLEAATCQTSTTSLPLTSKGKFQNVLLGQTITLSLNVRLDCTLGRYAFCEVPEGEALVIITRRAVDVSDGVLGDPDGCAGPGTSDDLADTDPGPDGCLGTADDAVKVVIPASVISALKLLHDTEPGFDVDVNGLLELANRALAGDLSYITAVGGTISDINQAVDAINRGFDNCRFIFCCGTASTCDFAVCAIGSSQTSDTIRMVANEHFGVRNNFSTSFLKPFDWLTRRNHWSLSSVGRD